MVCFTLKRVQGAFSQDSGSLWKPSSQPRRLMLPNLRGTDARTRGENAVRVGGGTARPTGWGSGWQTRPGAHTHRTTARGSGGRWVPGRGDGAPQTWGRPPEVDVRVTRSTLLYPAPGQGRGREQRLGVGVCGRPPRTLTAPLGCRPRAGRGPLFRRATGS